MSRVETEGDKGTKALPLFAPNVEAILAQIKKDSGFPDNFDLKTPLLDIWSDNRNDWFEEGGSPSNERRDFLNAFHNGVLKLFRLVSNAPSSDVRYLVGDPPALSISSVLDSSPPTPSRVAELNNHLSWLRDLAATALARHAPSGPKRSPRLVMIVNSLRLIYVRALGPTAPRSTKSDVYGGKFMDFIAAVLPILGETTTSNSQLAEIVSQVNLAVDRLFSDLQSAKLE